MLSVQNRSKEPRGGVPKLLKHEEESVYREAIGTKHSIEKSSGHMVALLVMPRPMLLRYTLPK